MVLRKRKSRSDGEIYQVDLIAALFAGYTIVWIATSDEQKILEAQTDLKLATLRVSIIGELAGSAYLQRAGVQALSETACAPDTFSEFVDSGKIGWHTCEITAKPVRLNAFNDSLSILEEDRDNPANKRREPCADATTIQNSPTILYSSVLDATLLDVSLPIGLSLIGLGYGSSESDWPPMAFGQTEDRIPKFIGIEEWYNSVPRWNPAGGMPPYRCSYDRDRSLHLESLYLAEGFDATQAVINVSVNSDKGSDFFHVYSASGSEAVSFTSPQPYPLLNASSLAVQQDFSLDAPQLSLRLCFHEDGIARCWSADGALVSGASYSLTREP